MSVDVITLPRKSVRSPVASPNSSPDFSITIDASAFQAAASDAVQLRTVELLRGASPSDIEALESHSVVRDLAPGATLFTEGQPTRSVFLVKSGALEIRRSRETTPLAAVNTADWVGIFGLLAGRRRSAHARALVPTQLLEIDGAAFVKLLTKVEPVREAAKRHFHRRLSRLLCGSHPLFAELSSRERAKLSAAFRTLDLKAGKHFVLVEPEHTSLYVVAHGSLRLSLPELSESLALARGQIFGINAGSVALEPVTRLHLLRLSPVDCSSGFLSQLAARARAQGLFIDRHLFVGDAGLAGLT